MFEVEEMNCICVNWKKGSQTSYTQAAHNVRVVGAQWILNNLLVSQLLGQAESNTLKKKHKEAGFLISHFQNS